MRTEPVPPSRGLILDRHGVVLAENRPAYQIELVRGDVRDLKTVTEASAGCDVFLHLAYLNGLQKLNCVYCGYGNGLISFVREVSGRTEAYWCPIKHASRVPDPHSRYPGFVDYGNEEAFQQRVEEQREALTKPD